MSLSLTDRCRRGLFVKCLDSVVLSNNPNRQRKYDNGFHQRTNSHPDRILPSS